MDDAGALVTALLAVRRTVIHSYNDAANNEMHLDAEKLKRLVSR